MVLVSISVDLIYIYIYNLLMILYMKTEGIDSFWMKTNFIMVDFDSDWHVITCQPIDV